MIVLYIWTIVATVVATTTEAAFPVLMVPGIKGSQLWAKLNKKASNTNAACTLHTDKYFPLWLNVGMVSDKDQLQCLVDDLKLTYNSITRKTYDQDGVHMQVVQFGDPEVVENVDPTGFSFIGAYFQTIGDKLVSDVGLRRHFSLFGCSYDFRRGISEQGTRFKMIKELIEKIYQRNCQPIILIAHSYGGTLILHFLQTQTPEWKSQFIKALITLSGVWGGTVDSLKVYAVGDDLGHKGIVDGHVVRDADITFSSLASLLPNVNAFTDEDVFIQTPSINITTQNYQTFFNGINCQSGYQMYLDSLQYDSNVGPGVRSYCMYGSSVPTISMLKYNENDFTQDPNILYNDNGDGTVNLRSLEACKYWGGTQSQPVYMQAFPKVDHLGMLSDPNVLNYITAILITIT